MFGTKTVFDDLDTIGAFAKRAKIRHDGQWCYEQVFCDEQATRYWHPRYLLKDYIRHVLMCDGYEQDAAYQVLYNEYKYNDHNPTIPLMIQQASWSTKNGVYDCVTDQFIPSRGIQKYRTSIARTVFQVTRDLPFDVVKHIASFLLDGNHIPEDYCTMSFYPFDWTPSIRPTLTKTLAAMLQPHNWITGSRVFAASIGQMIIYPMSQHYTLFVDDPHEFVQSNLYALLVSMTNFNINLESATQYPFLSWKPHHINIMLQGTPSDEKETCVMDVIQWCCYWYKHREVIAQTSPWIVVPQLDEKESLLVDPAAWDTE